MSNKSFYTIQNVSGKEADILIYGIIGDPWADKPLTDSAFVSDFKNLEAKVDRINVRINSPGGSVYDGLPIYNVIASSKKDVHIYIDGLAASMGAIISQAGKKGKVHIASNGLMLMHSPMSIMGGNAKDMRDMAEYLDKVQETLIVSISDRTGMSAEELKQKWFDYADHWLSPEEALKDGLVDSIENYHAETPKNIQNKSLSDILNSYKTDDSENKESFFSSFANLFHVKAITPVPEETNTVKNMKNVVNLLAILAISELTLTDNKVTLTEDQVNAIEGKLAQLSDLENKLKEAEEAKAKAESDIAAAKEETLKLQKEFDAFKNEDAERETIAQKKRDEENNRLQEEIDNMPHNKAADQIL